MASQFEDRLKEPGFKRIILGGLAFEFLLQELEPYINSVINQLHHDLINHGYAIPKCTNHTYATYKDVNSCTNPADCGKFVKFLNTYYDNGNPRPNQGNIAFAWKNSDFLKWGTDPWQLALLFMDKGQDPTKNKGPLQTDMTGTTNLLFNCTRFLINKQLVLKIRSHRNVLAHHTASFCLGEKEFETMLVDIEALLGEADVKPHITTDVKKELQKLRVREISDANILRSLCNHLNERRMTLANMVKSRLLYDKEVVADSQTLLQNMRLHLVNTNMDSNQAIKVAETEIQQHIKSLQVTGVLIARYQQQDFQWINAMPWLKHAAMLIDSSYVDITLAKAGDKVTMEAIRPEGANNLGNRFSNLADLLPEDPTLAFRVLLTGPAGSSKSTTTKRLARLWKDAGRQGNMDGYSLLFVIPASMLTILPDPNSPLNQIEVSLVNHLLKPHCSNEQLHNILHHHQHALLVVDGYDEGSKQQQNLVDKILSHEILGNVTVLVTAREGFIARKQRNIAFCSLGFDDEQKKQYVNKFFRETNCDESVEQSVLSLLVNSDSFVSDLCTNPMSAYMVCLMASKGIPLDSKTNSELYSRMYEFIQKRAHSCRAKQVASIRDQFRTLEKALFYHITRDNAYVLTEGSVKKHIQSSEEANMLLECLPQLGLTTQQHAIVELEEQTFHTLNHKSLAEFLAAKYVVQLEYGEKVRLVEELIRGVVKNREILVYVYGLESLRESGDIVRLFLCLGDICLGDAERRRLHESVQNMSDGGAAAEVVTQGFSRKLNYLKSILEMIKINIFPRYTKDINNHFTRRLLTALVADVTLTDATVRPLLAVWAPILERIGKWQQFMLLDLPYLFQWEGPDSGEDTLQQAVLRVGRLGGVKQLWGHMSAATTDLLLRTMPRLTGLTHIRVCLHTAAQCRQLWRGAGQLTALKQLQLKGRGEYQAKAEPGKAHTTPDDSNVTPGGVALPAPPLLSEVKLHYLPLQTAAQLAPLCGWVRESHELQNIFIYRCGALCAALRQELGAALRQRYIIRSHRTILHKLLDALRQRDACMDKVQIYWEAGDGEAAEWEQLEQELGPYARELSVSSGEVTVEPEDQRYTFKPYTDDNGPTS